MLSARNLSRTPMTRHSGSSTATPPVTTFPASYGGVGSYGWEIEIDRVAAGLITGTPAVTVFVLQNGGDGGYPSSDFIPQTSAPLTTNNGNLADGAFDFTALPGLQAATIQLNTTGTVLGTKAVDEASVAMSVFPNPASSSATVVYNVRNSAEQVNVVLTDLLGRQVRVLTNGLVRAGIQSLPLSTADVAAGTYLVRVQVGDKVATRKVVLL